MDGWIWNCMQEHVYKKPIRHLAQMKQRLVGVWADFEHLKVDRPVKEAIPSLSQG